MKKSFSGFISVILSFVMILGMIPGGPVFAESETAAKITLVNPTIVAGTDEIEVLCENVQSNKDWICIYSQSQTVGTSVYSGWMYANEGVVTFSKATMTPDRYANAPGREWPLRAGEYQFVLFANGGYTEILDQKTLVITEPEDPEPQPDEENDAVYYVEYGGTGDGTTAETPAGTIYDIITKINADGYGEGDNVVVKISKKGNPDTFSENKFVGFHTAGKTNPAHTAKITFTSADASSTETWTNLVIINDTTNLGTNLTMTGPTEFRDIYIVSQFPGYMRNICAQGHEVTFGNVIFRTNHASTHAFIDRNDAPINLAGNRNINGTAGNGAKVVFDNPEKAVKLGSVNMSAYLAEMGNNYTVLPNDSTFILNGGAGSNIATLVLLSASAGYANGLASNPGKRFKFEGNVNIVLYNTTVNSFCNENAKPIVEGAVQVLLNSGSNIKSNTASAYSSAELTDDAPMYILTSASGGTLELTDTAGTYNVEGGKVAYVMSEDKRTVYYGAETISVPAPGIYEVNYADSIETIKSNVNPGGYNGMQFAGWSDDGNGILTAEFGEVQREYYVKYGGNGVGISPESPAGSFGDIIKKINSDGHGAGDAVTVYVIPTDGAAANVGDVITADNFKFVSLYTTQKHEAKIEVTTYNYDSEEKNYAPVTVYPQYDPVQYNNLTTTGPLTLKNLILLDTRTDYRTSIYAQGYDLELKNIVRRRISKSGNTFSVIKNAKTEVYTNSNRLGAGEVGEGGRVSVDDGNEYDLYFGGYTTGNGHDEVFENDCTFDVNNTNINIVDLSATAAGRIFEYKKSVNLILNNSNVTNFRATRSAVVGEAIQIILNGNSKVNNFTAASSATVSNDSGAENTPVYIMNSPTDGALDVTGNAGVYSFNSSKAFAYAFSDGTTTAYYGSDVLAVGGAGTYNVGYANSVDEIIEKLGSITSDPATGMLFKGWKDNGDGTLSAILEEKVPETRNYYVKYGGTGDGRSVDAPAPTVVSVINSVNADGLIKGDTANIYVIQSDDWDYGKGVLEIGQKDGKRLAPAHHITAWGAGASYTPHTATVNITSYDPENPTYLAATLKLGENHRMVVGGPTNFSNIVLIDMRAGVREFSANGFDVTYGEGTVFGKINHDEYNGTARAWDGVINLNGSPNLPIGDAYKPNTGAGGTVRFNSAFNATSGDRGVFIASGASGSNAANRQVFTNNVKIYFDNPGIASSIRWGADNASVTTSFGSGLSIIVNNAQSLKNGVDEKGAVSITDYIVICNNGTSFPEPPSYVTAERTWKLHTAKDAGGALDVTDTAGTFEVLNENFAYVQLKDNKTVYYGAGTITLPEGEYEVKFAADMDELLNKVVRPADIDEYNLFDSWVDDGNGVLTAKYVYSIPTYYVSASGSDSNDGLTPETAFATTTAAIDGIGTKNGVIYCIGNVVLTDKAHNGKIYYESYNGGTIAGPSNTIQLAGPAAINADFTASQNIFTNGHYLELGGKVDASKSVQITIGNEQGLDEKLVLNGKFVQKLVTRVKNQTSGKVDIVINGGVLRQMSTGSGTSGDASYTVDSVSVTVISGEFWCLNHTDNGPHKATGAFEYIANGNSYYFDEARMLLNNYPITTWVDFTPGGTGGFPKIQFDGGKWIIRSADKDGNILKATEVPGRYSVSGTKTPYYITENGQNVYYGKDGYINLPTGIIDVIWTDSFVADKLPEPELANGFEFMGWDDDGAGLLTAIIGNPNFYYVDNNGSDGSMGTENAPFKSISKAIAELDGRNGNIYIINEAIYDSESVEEFGGVVTISGVSADAVLTYGENGNMIIKGNTRIKNITLKNAGNAETAIESNGHRFEIGENVVYDIENQEKMNISAGGSGASEKEKIVLPEGDYSLMIGADGIVSDKTHIVMDSAVADIKVNSSNSDAVIRVAAENTAIGNIDIVSSLFGSLEIVSNGRKQAVKSDGNNIWVINSASDEGRIDFTENAGVYGVQSVYGKTPVAVSENGTVYVAGDYVSEDIAPDTFYQTNDYAEYINYRKPLSNTYKKLTADKSLNVVYFGGSVTAGYGSSDTSKFSWRALIGQWLIDNFPDAKINNINRAVGESGTYLGSYRVQRDVIAHKPDLVFLEYSINDRYYSSGYDKAKYQYETIVREIKEALPDCDIVTILVTDSGCVTTNRNGGLHSEAQAHEDMAKIYNIPSLHVGRVLADTLPGTTASGWSSADWSKYAIDGVHLNDAGNYVYYECIREYMNNSLFGTEHTGRTMRHDELVPVVNDKLFDGNRTVIQPTAEFIAKSEALGGSGFKYNSGLYGVHDYYGIASASSENSVLAFELDGTDVAIMSNFYTNSYFSISIDGGEYVTKECSGHSPTRIVENLESGKHIIRIKPVFGSASGSPKSLNIGAIFTRDVTKATVKGTEFEYTDYSNHTLSVPAGCYDVQYLVVSKVSDIQFTAKENQIFLGWKDADGNDISKDAAIEPGMVLVPQYLDVNDYFDFAGAQIRVKTDKQDQGLRFVVDKKSAIDSEIDVKNFGMVVIPSLMLGDNRSYTDYDPNGGNSLRDIVGAEKLYIGSSHDYNGKVYSSAEVIAEKIFAELDDGVRYTTCITNIPENGYGKYYTLKPFIRYMCDGEEYVAYGDAFRSSIYEISRAASVDAGASEETKRIAEEIISIVENG